MKIVGFILGAILLNVMPWAFALGSIVLCIVLFYKHSLELAWHERSWLTNRTYRVDPYSPLMEYIIKVWTFASLSFTGLLAAVLPIIGIRGTFTGRVIPTAMLLIMLIWVVYGVAKWVKAKLRYDPLRYGLLRFAYPAGLVFSICQSTFNTKSLGTTWQELTQDGDYWSDLWGAISGGNFVTIQVPAAQGTNSTAA